MCCALIGPLDGEEKKKKRRRKEEEDELPHVDHGPLNEGGRDKN